MKNDETGTRAMALASHRIHEVPDDLLAPSITATSKADRRAAGRPAGRRSVDAMLARQGRPSETVIATHPATELELSLHAAR